MTTNLPEIDQGIRVDDAKFKLWKAQGLDLAHDKAKTPILIYLALLGALALLIYAITFMI